MLATEVHQCSEAHPDKTFAGGPFDRRQWSITTRLPARLFVWSGLAMFALYIFMDVVASLAYDGYSYRDQTISELSATGAPTRTFWLVMSVGYQVVGFASRSVCSPLRGAAGASARWGGSCWRRDSRAVVVGRTDASARSAGGGRGHVAGHHAPRRWRDELPAVLRHHRHRCVRVREGIPHLLARHDRGHAGLRCTRRAWRIPNVSENQPTAWLGIWERIAIEGAILWQAVFAAMLLWRMQGSQAPGDGTLRSV